MTQFVTQFAHTSRHSRAKNRKQNLNFRENCFENLVSALWTRVLYVYNTTMKNVQKHKKVNN